MHLPREAYDDRNSPIHRLTSSVKAPVALALVVGIVVLPRTAWWAYAGMCVLLATLAVSSRVSLARLLRRMICLEPFVLGVALLSLFQEGGVVVFLGLVVKSSLSLFCMLILSATTPFFEILRALRALMVPQLLVTVLALMYRYLFLLVEEGTRMRRARESRTFTKRPWRTWERHSSVVAQLYVRSSSRAERLYGAMCARGWDG